MILYEPFIGHRGKYPLGFCQQNHWLVQVFLERMQFYLI